MTAARRRTSPHDFPARFRTLAEEHTDEICAEVIRRACKGERWAAELVMQYAFDRSAEASEDALVNLLEEIRARLAHSA
ncbi:MAG: hypothetical protein OXG33_03465 [Chloroflexi bacterium]|nr:hypothetical protein [Chloroflexota bacterium]